MESIINLNEIEYMPFESLMILKDNYSKKDYYSLCLKTKEYISSFSDFKISFCVIDNVPICILMVKLNNRIYKCLIGFELEKEFEYLKNLMLLKSFNLFLMTDYNEHQVIEIKNNKNNKFLNALLKVKKTTKNVTCDNLKNAKQKILDMYSDEELWNNF